jgi:chaperonin GroES
LRLALDRRQNVPSHRSKEAPLQAVLLLMQLALDTRLSINSGLIQSPNLADRFSAQDLTNIGSQCWLGFSRDKSTRAPWESRMRAAMDLAMQVASAKTFPWQGAANVIFPLVTIAALQFYSRAYPALVQGNDVARYRVYSGSDQKLVDRANRISKHMSWHLLEGDTSWEEQHARLLINIAVVGSAFKKTYYNANKGMPVSELVMARDLVMDYWAKSVEGAARKTHTILLYPNEVYERAMDDVFLDVRNEAWFTSGARPPFHDISEVDSATRAGLSPASLPDHLGAFTFLEQHTSFDFDGDGYAEPYTVTLEANSRRVVRIVSRIADTGDVQRVNDRSTGAIRRIKAEECFTKYGFIPSPDGGIYDIGFGLFLGPINEAVSTAVNQILDHGTINNSMGGFLGRGAKIRGGVYTVAPWEWKRVDSSGDDLRKNMVPFPERKVSDATFQLLSLLITYADRLAGTTETMVGENPGQNTPAETSRNMTEQGMKIYAMIFKGAWRSEKEEFRKLYTIFRQTLPIQHSYGESSDFIRNEDYKGKADLIAPVADPNMPSTAMQQTQAGMVATRAHSVPGYDRDAVERLLLKSFKVDNIDTIFKGEKATGPLPNPVVMKEQMKLQGTQMKEQGKEKIEMAKLRAAMPKLQAEIDLLKAQAVQIVAEIGAERAAQQVEQFELRIKAFEAIASVMGDHLDRAQQGEQHAAELAQQKSESGGLGGMADKPSDGGVS